MIENKQSGAASIRSNTVGTKLIMKMEDRYLKLWLHVPVQGLRSVLGSSSLINKGSEDNDVLNEDDTAVNESDEDRDYLNRACLFANNAL